MDKCLNTNRALEWQNKLFFYYELVLDEAGDCMRGAKRATQMGHSIRPKREGLPVNYKY